MANLELDNRELVADWIETTALARGRSISRGALEVAGLSDAGISESQIAGAVMQMKQRAKLLGDSYPIDVDGLVVRPKIDLRNNTYSALLQLSPGSPVRQLLHSQPNDDMSVLLERLSVDAMMALLGSDSCALRFGHPSDIGRPERFHQAIEWLAEKMGIEAGSGFKDPRRKDGGVDVVAWRPFPDGRSGFPLYLVQCTMQRQLFSKARDIDLRLWSGWLRFDVDPMTVLAVPGTISKGEEWDEIAVRSMILDRIRLTGLLPDPEVLKESITANWMEKNYNKLAELLSGATQ